MEQIIAIMKTNGAKYEPVPVPSCTHLIATSATDVCKIWVLIHIVCVFLTLVSEIYFCETICQVCQCSVGEPMCQSFKKVQWTRLFTSTTWKGCGN